MYLAEEKLVLPDRAARGSVVLDRGMFIPNVRDLLRDFVAFYE
jgi:hypothetical protein